MREAVQAELTRLGVASPPAELAAWLDDTEAYAAPHARKMIDTLVALGAEARKADDPIAAAGDYNRALAHAPDDPQLLRIVAGMNRAEARTRLLRRAGVALLLMVGLGGVAFGVGRALHARTPAPIKNDTVAAPPVSATPAVPSSAPSASASVAARPVSVPVMRVQPAPSAKAIERTLSLDLTPSMGVQVSVDGAPARGVATGDTLPIDGKAHSLAFTCPVCVPAQRDVVAGDKDDTVVVRLAVKPATLDITGDGNKSYQIVEHPEVAVRVGANSVAMHFAFENVTVKQMESGVTVPVRLSAGHVVEAPF